MPMQRESIDRRFEIFGALQYGLRRMELAERRKERIGAATDD